MCRLVLAALLLLSCACPHAPAPERPSVPAASAVSVAAPTTAPPLPVLRVGTSGDYAPFSKDGRGFDVEVVARMARDLGYRVEWVPFAWPELADAVAQHRFDVAASGITYRADRGVVGLMTRALAVGGACLLQRSPLGPPARVAVNRGGVLERWARERFDAEHLRTVDDNLSLPGLLERGEVDAIVTDSFELRHFARAGWASRCDPPRDRKVYWVSPAAGPELASRIDAWLAAHEAELVALRAQWLGAASSWSPRAHLIDLLARRLSLMPAVGATKAARGLPIDDPAREAVVIEQALSGAASLGLERESVRALFTEQIELAKAVQRRDASGPALDLDTVLRPALDQLGARILEALAVSAAELPSLQLADLDLLELVLRPDERARMLAALQAVRSSRR